jgi:hypothetical protein
MGALLAPLMLLIWRNVAIPRHHRGGGAASVVLAAALLLIAAADSDLYTVEPVTQSVMVAHAMYALEKTEVPLRFCRGDDRFCKEKKVAPIASGEGIKYIHAAKNRVEGALGQASRCKLKLKVMGHASEKGAPDANDKYALGRSERLCREIDCDEKNHSREFIGGEVNQRADVSLWLTCPSYTDFPAHLAALVNGDVAPVSATLPRGRPLLPDIRAEVRHRVP